MQAAAKVIWLFAAFTLAGGVIGLIKAGSGASLIAGSVAALLLALCAAGVAKGFPAAGWASIAVCLALAVRFWGKWIENHRVMPELLMGVFSLAVIGFVLFALLTRRV